MTRESQPAPSSTAGWDHYPALDALYRSWIGPHLHHGLWLTPTESLPRAQQNLEDRVLTALGPLSGRHVWDIGCGYGTLARRLHREGAASVTGFNPQAQQLPSDPAIHWRAQAWPPPLSEMAAPAPDALVFLESLEHMPDPPTALCSAATVLSPAGRLVIASLLPSHFPDPLLRRTLPLARYSLHLPPVQEIVRHLDALGFSSIHVTDLTTAVRPTWPHLIRAMGRRALHHPLQTLRWAASHPAHGLRFALGSLAFWHHLHSSRLRYVLIVADHAPDRTHCSMEKATG
ncbi:MAG: methyltransferase domain-containing protein [Verrucomicrobiales bacterium]|nr:methyltransferase domain-containing protein [Verrucomicrobiales bacterium]